MTNIAKKKFAFDLSLLSKYRTELMGISMLMVLVCHARLHGANLPDVILSLLALGDRGVELFFLLSGIGIFYSLSSFYKSDQSIYNWYKKRLVRILVPYLIIETPFWVFYCINNHLGGAEFLSYLSMISFWTDHVGPWFIAFLIPLYIISPFCFKLFSHSKLTSILFCALLVIASILFAKHPFQDYGYDSHVLENIKFCIQRAPSYFIGLCIGPYVKENKRLPFYALLLLIAVYFLIPIIPLTRGCFRGWIIGIFLLLALSLLLSKINNNNICGTALLKFLSIIGAATLEIYLFEDVTVNSLNGLIFGTSYFVLTVILALFLGIVFHYIYLKIKNKESLFKF